MNAPWMELIISFSTADVDIFPPNLWLTNSTGRGKITTGRPRRKTSVRRSRAAIIQDRAEAENDPQREPWYAAWPGPLCDQAASFQRRYRDARLDGGREHLLHTEREDEMPESVYKVIELIGTSNESWEKAAANAVEQAAKSLRELRVAEVVKLDMQLDAKGKVEAYRAKVNVSFKFEGS
jgi:dodecin